jgi:hypothetical protein
MRAACLVVLLIAWGCRASPFPAVTRSGPASNRLPRLTLHHVSHDIDASPPYLDAGFRIGPQGLVVSQYDAGDGMLFSIIDSVGSVVGRFGRIGLPCPGFSGGWSLNDSWLALACAPNDPAFDGDAIFKVFRITD